MGEDRTVSGAHGEAPGREFHEVADLFPLMRGAAFQDLVADIRQNGLREPILCDAEGRILDGRNRYRACLEAGVEPRFVAWKGEGTLPELALSLNLRRRHLDESQRAMVAARLARLFESEAAARRGARTDMVANLPPGSFGKSRSRAGALVNISPRLVSSALKVLREGSEELIAAVEAGEIAVSTAADLTRLPRGRQALLVAGGVREIARAVRELRAGKAEALSGGRSGRRPAWFGLFKVTTGQPGAAPDVAGVGAAVLIWVAADRLSDAIAALTARGFRHFSPAGDGDREQAEA